MFNVQKYYEMNELQNYHHDGLGDLRATLANGEPMFLAKDVAALLGYSNPQKAVRDHVEDEDKLTERFVLSGQGRDVTLINESGLYSLILSSKLPKAKEFKHWVTSEVLPSIRKTGGYVGAKEDDTPEVIMAKALQIANNTLAMQKDRIGNLEGEVKLLEPDAKYARETLKSTDALSINAIAKEFGMSAVTLNAHLKRLGIQYKQGKQWLLYSKYQDKGYTKTRTYQFVHKDGTIGTSLETRWTEKGRRFLHELHDKGDF